MSDDSLSSQPSQKFVSPTEVDFLNGSVVTSTDQPTNQHFFKDGDETQKVKTDMPEQKFVSPTEVDFLNGSVTSTDQPTNQHFFKDGDETQKVKTDMPEQDSSKSISSINLAPPASPPNSSLRLRADSMPRGMDSGYGYEQTVYAVPVLPSRTDIDHISARRRESPGVGRGSAMAAFTRRLGENPSIQHQELFAIPWYIILPNRPFHVMWDIIVLIATVYVAIWVPISVAFHLSVRPLDFLVEFIFITDVILRFFTAYMTDSMLLVTDLKSIAKHYFSTWFFLDLLACYPLYFHHPNFGREYHMLRLFRLLRLFRFNRYRYDGDAMSEFCYMHFIDGHPTAYRLCKLVLILFLSGHILGCLFVAAGNPIKPDPNSWLMDDFGGYSIYLHTNFGIYVLGLYWCLTTMLTVGYGDISPQTYPELAVAMCTELVGVVVFAFITGIAVSLVSSSDAREGKFREQMESLGRFLHKNAFPKDLQNTIRLHASMEWMKHRTGGGLSLEELKPMLPRPVQHDMCYHIYSSLIEKSNFLTKLLEYFKPFALELLTEFTVVRMKAGTIVPPGSWYLISLGAVDVYVHGLHISTLTVGRSFGLSLAAGAAKDPALNTTQHVVQHTPTVMYSVSAESFAQAVGTLDHETKACLDKYLASCIEIKRVRVKEQYEKAKERENAKLKKDKGRTKSENPLSNTSLEAARSRLFPVPRIPSLPVARSKTEEQNKDKDHKLSDGQSAQSEKFIINPSKIKLSHSARLVPVKRNKKKEQDNHNDQNLSGDQRASSDIFTAMPLKIKPLQSSFSIPVKRNKKQEQHEDKDRKFSDDQLASSATLPATPSKSKLSQSRLMHMFVPPDHVVSPAP